MKIRSHNKWLRIFAAVCILPLLAAAAFLALSSLPQVTMDALSGGYSSYVTHPEGIERTAQHVIATPGELLLAPMATTAAIQEAQRTTLGPAGYTLASKEERCLEFVRRIYKSSSGLPASVAGWSEGKRRRDATLAEGVAANCFIKSAPRVPHDAYTTELYTSMRSKFHNVPAECSALAIQADRLYSDPKTTAIDKSQWLEKLFLVATAKGCLR
jgi:hypothetical protein